MVPSGDGGGDSRCLLQMSLGRLIGRVVPFHERAQAIETELPTGEMHRHQPGTQCVDEMMEHVRVGHAVDGRVDGDAEEHDVSDVARAAGEAGDHLARGEGLDEDEVGHDGEDVVVGGERGEPVDGEVAGPDEEDGDVDGQDPEH